MRFPKKLAFLMSRDGLTQKALADKLHLSHRAIGKWQTGSRPRPAAARQLAELFQIPVDLLLDDSAELPSPTPAEIAAGKEVAKRLSLIYNSRTGGFKLTSKTRQLLTTMESWLKITREMRANAEKMRASAEESYQDLDSLVKSIEAQKKNLGGTT
jgi:transcriptional regulator with XRE-family HTH domain